MGFNHQIFLPMVHFKQFKYLDYAGG